MENKRNQGITLVALVVTIIVLLILAGISISMLTGQNGILNKSVEAKEKTESGNELELVKTSAMEALTEGKGIVEEENLKKALDKNIGEYEIEYNENRGWKTTIGDRRYIIKETGEVVYPVAERIEVTPPTKTTYESAEEIDTTGMKVIAYFLNGKEEDVTDKVTISEKSRMQTGEKPVVVSYGGCEEEFTITREQIYTVTVDGEFYAKGEFNTLIELNAESEKDGKQFSGWKLGENVISFSQKLNMRLSGDMNFTKVYGEKLEKEDKILLTGAQLTKNTNGTGNVRVFYWIILKPGSTLNECGCIWTGRNKTNMPKLYENDGTMIGKKVQVTKINSNNKFGVAINNIPKGKTARSVGYMKVTNNGVTKFIFSDEDSITNY